MRITRAQDFLELWVRRCLPDVISMRTTMKRAPHVAVINRARRNELYGADTPLGRRFRTDLFEGDWEVIGVVADAKYSSLRRTLRDGLPAIRSTSPDCRVQNVVRAIQRRS